MNLKKWKWHRKKLRKPIRDLWKILEWKMDDQVLIAGVWLLRKNELDRPFDDRINDVRCLSHLHHLMMMEEGEKRL